MKNNITTLDLLIGSNEHKTVDKMIILETIRRVEKVKAFNLGIRTACFIDGEFTLISDYDISPELTELLKNA